MPTSPAIGLLVTECSACLGGIPSTRTAGDGTGTCEGQRNEAMPMRNRISIVSDDDPRFPMQAFFNVISDSDFVCIIADLLQGIGAGVNDVYCQFPADVDPDVEPFEGVRFQLYEDVFVADLDTFRQFLLITCEAYLREHPEDRAAIDAILSQA